MLCWEDSNFALENILIEFKQGLRYGLWRVSILFIDIIVDQCQFVIAEQEIKYNSVSYIYSFLINHFWYL